MYQKRNVNRKAISTTDLLAKLQSRTLTSNKLVLAAVAYPRDNSSLAPPLVYY